MNSSEEMDIKQQHNIHHIEDIINNDYSQTDTNQENEHNNIPNSLEQIIEITNYSDPIINENVSTTQDISELYQINNGLNSGETDNYISEDSIVDDEQTTDYNNQIINNQSSQQFDFSENIDNLIPNSQNISIISSSNSIIDNSITSNSIINNSITSNSIMNNSITSNSIINQQNSQYMMLHENDINNPFFKCNLEKLEYDTDDEETQNIRIIYTWNYEFNYDFFNLNDVSIFISKEESFNSKLNELKNIRNNQSNNITGKIIKLPNDININKNTIVNIYLIAYYDNAKINIEFYGIFNQEIDENKLIDNIKNESTYGKKGILNPNHISNLQENDFIILHRKIHIY